MTALCFCVLHVFFIIPFLSKQPLNMLQWFQIWTFLHHFLPCSCTLTSADARLVIQKPRKINHLSTSEPNFLFTAFLKQTIPAATAWRKNIGLISAFVGLQHWLAGVKGCGQPARTPPPHPQVSVCPFIKMFEHLALEDVWRLRLYLCREQRVDIRPNPVRLCAWKRVQDSLWPKRGKENRKWMNSSTTKKEWKNPNDARV